MFSCEVTEVMRLQGDFRLILPSQICLPRLRVLTLSGLTFNDHRPLNLLFGGPALEKLVIQDCDWEGGKSEVTISAPKLKQLTIEETHELYRPTEHASKSVTISAPEVEVFHYEGGILKSYHFHCPSSITDATLESHDFLPIEDLHIDHLSEVLTALQSVECLQLASYFVKALTHASVPVFKNLIRLDLSEDQVDLSSKELEKMLNQCPRVETLTFLGGISTDYCARRLLSSNLTCLSSTLKRISISYFNGNTSELFAVQFLLWKGTCLEKMDIYCYEGGDAPKEIGLFLSACHRSSETCELYVG
ncbi:hypothetical protein DM860_015851 [Cuscuta australis]|uniref:FBD domain-containing protein n=1 Tax=Cuscuta australis TaxID=267555 RepID=A0A328DY92_9ASTE|nr:hypothetical protein DM860_015851 [Cuscuta australis]